MFIHKSVLPTRYCVNRLLEGLRDNHRDKITITLDITWDINWVTQFMPHFNGTTTYNHTRIVNVNKVEVDA